MKRLAVTCLLLVAGLTGAGAASAGDVTLSIRDGRVILFAQDATLGQILAEWARIGNTRIINPEKLPTKRVTFALADETESQALAVLLRSLGGYLAVRRAANVPGASVFDRIIILSGEAPALALSSPTPQAAGPALQSGARGPVQRRVRSDGSVFSFVENPDRPGEITMVDDEPGGRSASGGAGPLPGQMAPGPVNPDPLVGPGGRGIPIPAGSSVSSGNPGQPGSPMGGQTSADPFNLQSPVSVPPPGTAKAPATPGAAAKPGVVVPGQKPPGPPKGPGDEPT